MPKIVALVSGFGWHVQDLRRAAGDLRIDFRAVAFPKITGWVRCGPSRVDAGGHELTAVDGVLVRMMPPGTLEQVVFRMDALHRVAASGVPVLNSPAAVETAVDKYLALARLEAAGVPVPRTWTGESAKDALDAFEALGGDVVVKPLFGSEGRGLSRVTEREIVRRVFFALERVGAVLYVQEYIPHSGHDWRVFVLDGRVLGTIRRHARPGDWRTNIAVGGRAEAAQPPADIERLAIRSAQAVGAQMAGVDLLVDSRDQFVVLEVNAVPGWRALAAATGIDVATSVLEAMIHGH
jgi:ribosomal protein S6--L-glutamate ligase